MSHSVGGSFRFIFSITVVAQVGCINHVGVYKKIGIIRKKDATQKGVNKGSI